MPAPQPPEPSRRRLLGRATQTVAAAAAASLAGPAAGVAAEPVAAAVAPQAAPPKGYHDTEHNRRYYRLARY